MPPSPVTFLTMTEVCTRLRLRYATVLRMLNNKEIVGAYKVGSHPDPRYKRWRIPESEVHRIMTTRVKTKG